MRAELADLRNQRQLQSLALALSPIASLSLLLPLRQGNNPAGDPQNGAKSPKLPPQVAAPNEPPPPDSKATKEDWIDCQRAEWRRCWARSNDNANLSHSWTDVSNFRAAEAKPPKLGYGMKGPIPSFGPTLDDVSNSIKASIRRACSQVQAGFAARQAVGAKRLPKN